MEQVQSLTCTRTSTLDSTTPGSISRSKREAGLILRSECARSYLSLTRIVATVAQAAATEAATAEAVEEASAEEVVAGMVVVASEVTAVAVVAEATVAAVVAARAEEATAVAGEVATVAVAVTSIVAAAVAEVAAAGQVVATHGPRDQLTWAPATIGELVAVLEAAIRSQDPAIRCTISPTPLPSPRHRSLITFSPK